MNRHLRRFLIVLVILAVLAGVTDRALWWFARDVGGSMLADRGFTDPTVEVGGFPFLTQALTGDFKDVHLTADSYTTRDGHTVRNLDVHAHGVTADLPHRTITSAENVEMALSIPMQTVKDAMASKLSAAGNAATIDERDGHLVASVDSPMGFTMTATVQLVPGPVDPQGPPALDVQLTEVSVSHSSIGGRLSADLTPPTQTVPLTGLPAGLAVREVTVKEDALTLALTGKDVTFDRNL